jgi:hypothetical protein
MQKISNFENFQFVKNTKFSKFSQNLNFYYRDLCPKKKLLQFTQRITKKNLAGIGEPVTVRELFQGIVLIASIVLKYFTIPGEEGAETVVENFPQRSTIDGLQEFRFPLFQLSRVIPEIHSSRTDRFLPNWRAERTDPGKCEVGEPNGNSKKERAGIVVGQDGAAGEMLDRTSLQFKTQYVLVVVFLCVNIQKLFLFSVQPLIP